MSTIYDYRKYAALYVDDEEQALKYFRKGLEKEFQTLTATSVADALAILHRCGDQVGVILTDQRMPNQTGVDLLTAARQQWPGAIRLLTTAYSDIESAIAAVNSGAIYKYINKPAPLNELRETIKQAMELFITNREKETLLKERLVVLQRMIVADRVRSLAAMAGGISHHLRNSMTALTCFLEEAAPDKSGDPANRAMLSDPQFAQQLWELARKEREHLVQIVHRVGQGVEAPSCGTGLEAVAAELVQKGIDVAAPSLGGRPVSTDLAADLPRLRLDADCMTRLLQILLTYAARLSATGGRLIVRATAMNVAGAPGLQIRVAGEGPAWTDADVASFFTPFAFPASDPSELGVDLLSAYFTAYHHGGDIVVHQAPPSGPAFELLLPADPASVRRPELEDGLLEKLFTRFDNPALPKTQPGKAA